MIPNELAIPAGRTKGTAMNTTPDISTATEAKTDMNAGSSTNTTPPSHSWNRRPAAKRLMVALASAGLLLSAGAASAQAQSDDAPVRCEASGLGSADALERAADACELRYTDCMRNAPGTADSLERWVDRCYAKATA